MRMILDNLMPLAMTAALTCLTKVAVAGAASPAIQVWSQAIVRTDRVRLSDLAAVTNLDAPQSQAILAVEICDAPAAGSFEHVDIEQIRKALATGVNLGNICLTGAAQCRVFRPTEPTLATAGAAKDVVGKTGSADKTQAEQAAPKTLETAIREFLAASTANLGGRLEVRFGAAHTAVLDLAGRDMTFRVHPRGQSLLGLTTLDVDVLEAGSVTRTIPVLVEAALLKDVVVAVRPINRGAAIRAEDISLQERRFTRSEDVGLASVALVVNRQARRYIDPGAMLGVKDVQPLPLVRRGENVTVWLKRGGLTVSVGAKALRDGAQGDRIDVKAEPGGQVYSVIVTGLKTVEAESTGLMASR